MGPPILLLRTQLWLALRHPSRKRWSLLAHNFKVLVFDPWQDG